MIERLRKVEGHLTFYRLHVLVGLFIPLIAGAVLYASNTNYIAYVDALFSTSVSLLVSNMFFSRQASSVRLCTHDNGPYLCLCVKYESMYVVPFQYFSQY
jgi:hypothetical protein